MTTNTNSPAPAIPQPAGDREAGSPPGSASRTLRARVAEAIRKQIRIYVSAELAPAGIYGFQGAADAAIAEVMAWQAQPSTGWLFTDPGAGVGFSRKHPIGSGEVPDAVDIRPATVEALLDEMFGAWERLNSSVDKAAAWDACVASQKKGYTSGFTAGAEAMRKTAQGHMEHAGFLTIEDLNTFPSPPNRGEK